MVSEFVLGAVRAAVGVLRSLGLDYALFGGVAVNAWERIRATRDADLLLTIHGVDVDALKTALRSAGFAHHDRADRRELEEAGVLRFWWPAAATGFSIKVDVVLGRREYHREVLARRVRRRAFGEEWDFATVEDCILLKLVAGRPIDRADAVDLLRIHQSRVDEEYLRGRARDLEVARDFEEAWDEARGPEPPF